MSNQDTPGIDGSTVNTEIDIPPEISEQMEEAESHWLALLEWEARLRELEEPSEEELEEIRRLRASFAGASPDQEGISEGVSRLEQIQEERALRVLEHFEAGLDQQSTQQGDPE